MKKKRQVGFSLTELVIVVAIAFVLLALAMPEIVNALKNNRLRQAAVDYANLLQTARMRAVQDDQYYSVLGSTGTSTACLDLSQSGTTPCTAPNGSNPPAVNFHPTVQIQSSTSSSIPSRSNLEGQYLPSNCGTNAACVSVDPNVPTFSSRGLPCGTTTSSGSTICNYLYTGTGGIYGTSNVPVAFEIFLQNTQTTAWEAVTVSPAGRIREWYYDGSSAWKPLN